MEVTTTPTVLADRYRVIRRLGSGGMATVFLAEDCRLGRKVAVKRLHSDSPEDAAQRFEREAKVGASLSHPNLVTVFDTVADEEGVLIVMEYVEGENLAQLMQRERVEPEQALAIVKGVAGALDHAHQAGVVHRDVKPANILVSPEGKAKLVDLGIATATERTQITAVGTVLGTPSYMAPEQLEGGKITKTVDVYALAAVAFELLSGRKARQGRTPVEIAHRIASDPVPDLRDAWSEAPPGATAALARAMAREPSERPGTAGAFVRELEEGLNGSRSRERTRTTRALAGSAGVGAAAAGATPPPPSPPASRARAHAPAPPPARFQSAAPSRRVEPARARRRVPTWIPLAAAILGLLAVAGAIAALSSGGSDKATPPVAPTHTNAVKPKKKATPATPATPATSTAPAAAAAPQQTTPSQTSTAPASTGTNVQKGIQLQSQAHSLIGQGSYDQAIPLDQQAVQALKNSGNITYAYALFDLGHALRLAGRPAEAIPVLEQRLKIDNQRAVVQAELDKAKAQAKKG